MQKVFLSITLFFATILCFADTPGKPKMYDSKISFQNVSSFKDYSFYFSANKGGELTGRFTTDTSFYLPASGGGPLEYFFCAFNEKTHVSTNTVPFHNYYSPDYVVILENIENNKLIFKVRELSNKNEIVKEGNTDEIGNKELIADAKTAKRNHYLKVGSLIALGLGALAGIVWFFKRRKKKDMLA